MKSWKRTIPTGGHWYITINEKLKNGVHLNRLHELKELRKSKMDMPINTFLIIEYFGDNRASVFRKSDNQTISSVYSPCQLNFEYKFEINHLAHTDTPDEILCYSKIKKTEEFEDESIGLEFYPNREIKFNVDFNNISIGETESKKTEFKLELNSSILENQQMTQFESIMKKLKKFDLDENITEDDVEFMSNLRPRKEKETNKEPKQEDEV
jgi:hypothetical protein